MKQWIRKKDNVVMCAYEEETVADAGVISIGDRFQGQDLFVLNGPPMH